MIARWEGHQAPVDHVRWAANSKRLVTLASDFEVRVWDVTRPGGLVQSFSPPHASGFWAMQGYVALSPGGGRVAYASGGEKDSKALVYDVESGKSLAEWDLPGGFEKLAANGPNRFVLIREQTASKTGNVTTTVYDLQPGMPLGKGRVIRKPKPGDERRFIEHWLLPDGKHYLWAGPRDPPRDRRIELYEVPSGKLVWSIPAGGSTIPSTPNCLLSEDLKSLWVNADTPPTLQYDLTKRDPPIAANDLPQSVSADRKWMAFTAPESWQPLTDGITEACAGR